jgi:hypothetical protein
MAIIASSIFEIPQFPEVGNCQGYDMDALVTEADILASNAVDVINTLVADRVPRTPANLLSAITAYALWGVTTEPGTASTIILTMQGKYILRQAQRKL